MRIIREITTKTEKHIELPQGMYYYKVTDLESHEITYWKIYSDDEDESFTYTKIREGYGEYFVLRAMEMGYLPFTVEAYLFSIEGYKGEGISEERFNEKLKEAFAFIGG